MHAPSLSGYQFEPIQHTTSTHRTSQQTDISSLFKPTKKSVADFITVEDPNTAWGYWAEKDFFHNPFSDQTLKEFINYVETACALYKIHTNLPSYATTTDSLYFRSFKHLTLPEALLYIYLLEEPLIKTPTRATLSIKQTPTLTSPLSLLFSVSEQGTVTNEWILHYDLQTLRVSITEKNTTTGTLRYIIRGKRLEEIEGIYRNKPFLLDPIWNPQKRDTLKEEQFKFGKLSTTLAYYRNEKYALLRQQTGTPSLTVKNITQKSKDNRTVITEKEVLLGRYTALNRLIFAKGYIIPVAGQFFILPQKEDKY